MSNEQHLHEVQTEGREDPRKLRAKLRDRREPQQPHRASRVAELAAIVLVMGIISIGLSAVLPRMVARPGPSAILGQAQISPLLSGPEALHIKATRVYLTAEGQEMERMPIEFWHNPDGDARLEVKNATGTVLQVLIRNDNTYSQQDPIHNTVDNQTETASQVAALRKPVEEMFQYKILLDQGELEPIGEEVVNGKPALVLAEQVGSEAPIPFRAYIDKEVSLTLRVVGIDYETMTGTPVASGTVVTEYALIERVDPNQLSADLFAIPSGQMTIQSTDDSVEDPVPTADPYMEP